MENTNEGYFQESLERFKTAINLSEDYMDYLKCKYLIENFDREKAFEHLQRIVHKYESQINQLGLFEDNVRVIHGVSYNDTSDYYIMSLLSFIGQRIPLYIFIREGEKEIMKEWEKRISFYGFNAIG